jgi:hypothetical protein
MLMVMGEVAFIKALCVAATISQYTPQEASSAGCDAPQWREPKGANIMRMTFTVVCVLFGFVSSAAGQNAIGPTLMRSGFQFRPADTQQKLYRLRAFPQNRFTYRQSKSGQPYYVYADAGGCACAYVGSQKAMDFYSLWRRGLLSSDQMGDPPSGGMSPESEIVTDMKSDDVEAEFDETAFNPSFE